MARAVMVSIEGVLSKGGPPNGPPIDLGLLLLDALRHRFKPLLSTTCVPVDHVEHWLAVHGIRDTHWLGGEEDEETYDTRMRHLTEARILGYEIGLVVDPDPVFCAEVMRQSICALLFSHPRFARPEARPDYDQPLKPWSAITEEIEAQKKMTVRAHAVDAEMEPE